MRLARFRILTVAVLLLALSGPAAEVGAAAPAEKPSKAIYVSPTGDDHGPGTFRKPWRSLQKAIARAPGGAAMLVLPGRYPAVSITRAFSRTLNVYGVTIDGARPRVAGVEIWGGRRIAVRGLRITGTSQVTAHPTRKLRQPARDILFAGNEFSVPRHLCLRIRSKSTRVRVIRNHIHRCTTGIGGPNTPHQPSRHIVIARNLIDHLSADGIQFGWWNDVLIRDNVIEDVRDPRHHIHNDAIQFTGPSARVTIARNLLRNSSQLLFVQPAFGAIGGVTVQDNLMYNARAYAVQLQGSLGVRFVHNIVWSSHYGGLLLRQGTTPTGVVVPTDTVIEDNVLSGFATTGGATAASFRGNVLGAPSRIPGVGNLVRTPRFDDLAAGDLQLVNPPIPGVGVRFSSFKWRRGRPVASLLEAVRGVAPPVRAKGLAPRISVLVVKAHRVRQGRRVVLRVALDRAGLLTVTAKARARAVAKQMRRWFGHAGRKRLVLRLSRKVAQRVTLRLTATDRAGNRSSRAIRRVPDPGHAGRHRHGRRDREGKHRRHRSRKRSHHERRRNEPGKPGHAKGAPPKPNRTGTRDGSGGNGGGAGGGSKGGTDGGSNGGTGVGGVGGIKLPPIPPLMREVASFASQR